jgi:hypothetical protein
VLVDRLGLNETLDQLEIHRFGEESNPADDDKNPILAPFVAVAKLYRSSALANQSSTKQSAIDAGEVRVL